MGEISEALRQARIERERRREVSAPPPPAAPAERPPRPAEAAPPAAPAPAREAVRIPTDRSGDWAGRAVIVDPRGRAAESYRRFALQVRRKLQERRQRGLFVTSGLRQEGKTTTVCNLALALASMAGSDRTALVDLDLRGPSVARVLGVPCRVGMDRVLRGEADLEAACQRVENANLDLYLVEGHQSAAHESISVTAFAETVRRLTERYELVLFDTPPVLLFPDAELIASHVRSGVAVVRAGVTPRSAFRPVLDEFPGDTLIGVFLNDAAQPRYLRSYYGYPSAEAQEPEGALP